MVIATLTNYDNHYGGYGDNNDIMLDEEMEDIMLDEEMEDIMLDEEMERLASRHQSEANNNPNKITPSLLRMIKYYRNINPRAASEELRYPTNDFLKRAASLALSSMNFRVNTTTGDIDVITPNGGQEFQKKIKTHTQTQT
jgi:hypothetical protein